MRKNLILIIIIIIITTISVYFLNENLKLKKTEIQIQKEAYINGLISSYNAEIQSCRKAAQDTKPKDSNNFIKENCLNPINQSRIADLLRSWGKTDILITEVK